MMFVNEALGDSWFLVSSLELAMMYSVCLIFGVAYGYLIAYSRLKKYRVYIENDEKIKRDFESNERMRKRLNG